MKSLLTTIAVFLLTALTSVAQDEAKSADQLIDEGFGAATGWFVNAIFSKINVCLLYTSPSPRDA